MAIFVQSDFDASRYCLADGSYTVSLNDTLLFDTHRKNALLVVTSEVSGENITLFSTSQVDWEVSSGEIDTVSGDDDDSPDTLLVVLVSVAVLVAVVVIIGGFWYV